MSAAFVHYLHYLDSVAVRNETAFKSTLFETAVNLVHLVLITVDVVGTNELLYLSTVLAVKCSLAGAVKPVAEDNITLASRYYGIIAELYLKAVVGGNKCTVL